MDAISGAREVGILGMSREELLALLEDKTQAESVRNK